MASFTPISRSPTRSPSPKPILSVEEKVAFLEEENHWLMQQFNVLTVEMELVLNWISSTFGTQVANKSSVYHKIVHEPSFETDRIKKSLQGQVKSKSPVPVTPVPVQKADKNGPGNQDKEVKGHGASTEGNLVGLEQAQQASFLGIQEGINSKQMRIRNDKRMAKAREGINEGPPEAQISLGHAMDPERRRVNETVVQTVKRKKARLAKRDHEAGPEAVESTKIRSLAKEHNKYPLEAVELTSDSRDDDDDENREGVTDSVRNHPWNSVSAEATVALSPVGDMPMSRGSSCHPALSTATQQEQENNFWNSAGGGRFTLRQFLVNLLDDPDSNASVICWTGRGLEFKFLQPQEVARRWGLAHKRPNMNYDKLSRALRYYYKRGIMQKVAGQRHVYRFVRELETEPETLVSPDSCSTSTYSNNASVSKGTATPVMSSSSSPSPEQVQQDNYCYWSDESEAEYISAVMF